MNCPEPLLQRITITIDIDHEPGYQYVATAALLDVISHLAHDGIEPWAGSLSRSPAQQRHHKHRNRQPRHRRRQREHQTSWTTMSPSCWALENRGNTPY